MHRRILTVCLAVSVLCIAVAFLTSRFGLGLQRHASSATPLSREEFKRIISARRVVIEATTKSEILNVADTEQILSQEIRASLELSSGEESAIPLRDVFQILRAQDIQPIASRLVANKDAVVQFCANVALASDGDSTAGDAVYTLVRDKSLSMEDQRIIRMMCDNIGIRIPKDTPDDIVKHLGAIKHSEPLLKTGDYAPEFDAVTLTGQRLKSADFRGKLLVVHFWAPSCGPCITLMPSHILALQDYDSEKVEVIFVSLDEDQDVFEKTVERFKIPFHNVKDGGSWGGKLARSFGVKQMPFDVVIDGQGRIISTSIESLAGVITSDP